MGVEHQLCQILYRETPWRGSTIDTSKTTARYKMCSIGGTIEVGMLAYDGRWIFHWLGQPSGKRLLLPAPGRQDVIYTSAYRLLLSHGVGWKGMCCAIGCYQRGMCYGVVQYCERRCAGHAMGVAEGAVGQLDDLEGDAKGSSDGVEGDARGRLADQEEGTTLIKVGFFH